MLFRTRANLSVFLGPFVILGYLLIATKGFSVSWRPDILTKVATFVLFACFIGMGFVSGQIEDSIRNQCNRWRAVIARLQKEQSPTLQDADLLYNGNYTFGYLIVYFLLAISFASVIVIILHLKVS